MGYVYLGSRKKVKLRLLQFTLLHNIVLWVIFRFVVLINFFTKGIVIFREDGLARISNSQLRAVCKVKKVRATANDDLIRSRGRSSTAGYVCCPSSTLEMIVN